MWNWLWRDKSLSSPSVCENCPFRYSVTCLCNADQFFRLNHHCWVTAFRGAGGECRLCVQRLINASLGFHWHFSGCRRRLPLLIWFCPSFVFGFVTIFHCPSISLSFIATASILKFSHANILSLLLVIMHQTSAIFYHGYLSQYLLNRLKSLPVPARGPACCKEPRDTQNGDG